MELVDRVEQSGCKTLDLRVGSAPGPKDIIALGRLVAFLRKRRARIVHAHSSKAGGLGRIARGFVPGVQCFYTPNAYYGMGGRRGVKSIVFNEIERRLGSIGTTIHVSKDEASFGASVLGIEAQQSVIVPNCVDTERFRPLTTQERLAWRSQEGISEDAVVLGTMGRLTFQKDPVTLYRALKPLFQEHPKLVLYHVGQGELDAELGRMVQEPEFKERVIRIPYLQDTTRFLGGLDAFLLTSRYEGLSFAILEAMSVGLPMVLTRAPGNMDFMELGLSHLESANVGDVAGVRGAIDRLLARLVPTHATNHREITMKKFSLEHCYGSVAALYESCLRQKS